MTEAVVEQEAFGQGGFFTSLGRPGRTGDQKTSRRFYHWNNLRSRRQHGIAEAPQVRADGGRSRPHRPDRRALERPGRVRAMSKLPNRREYLAGVREGKGSAEINQEDSNVTLPETPCAN